MSEYELTFNPGPTHLRPNTLTYLKDLLNSGYLSTSHRSSRFMEMSQKAMDGLRRQMQLPRDYHLFYQPSATVAMDTLLRNVVMEKSYHFVHGAFSKRFYDTARQIGLHASSFVSDWDLAVPWKDAKPALDTELITVTHNETSTGLAWPSNELVELRKAYPEPLIAVDVTSSFGAITMDWRSADLWFFSIQKVLGLPSGLGVLLVSPRAFAKAELVLKKKGGVAEWQSFLKMAEKMKIYQTPETPNMLAIALLAWVMEDWNLAFVEAETREKAELLYSKPHWKPYIQDSAWRSITVANFDVGNANAWHKRAAEQRIILGKGYGPLSDRCIRIANFPGIRRDSLQSVLKLSCS